MPEHFEGNRSWFRIRNVPLPQLDQYSRELVPVLIDTRSGLPLRLTLRWVMRTRRLVASEKTLTDDLRAAGLLYAFCEEVLRTELDDLFAGGHRLSARHIDQLIEYLRSGGGGGQGVRSLTTIGQLSAKIEAFLYWLAKPMDRGGTAFVPANDLVQYREQLRLSFAPIRAFRTRGRRKAPLGPEDKDALGRLIGPERGLEGRVGLPLRFLVSNPWRPRTRLRNWIGYRFAYELGLRRGEIGKLRTDDIRTVRGSPVVSIRRRPHDPADLRTSGKRPKVKTVERELPISELLAAAIRQYEHTLLRDGGRRGARSPYLLVTGRGSAISGSSLDAVWKAVTPQLGRQMSWHVLRHTWAEETAEDLLSEHRGKLDSDQVVLGILREMGGWSPSSMTPFLYIQNALKSQGNEYLRRRNARFDEGLG